ncbi:NACHT, LRR and PYD domains-containing protein 12-like [Megalops cyprinoides]|uniref:NACHT, LRR and PYD domains-containing protein 12-like n=1 Tax=Megalops cyprinoides TaxID=118141 RepID=UPI0018653B53|nr:NACHT, LRR and PYD domains-containing protein 12-like [Megalops cyprinoides]
MLEHYPADSALTVTLHILREMSLNNEALTLARKMGRELPIGGPRPRVTPPPPAGPIQGGTADIKPPPAGPTQRGTTDSRPQPMVACSSPDVTARTVQEKIRSKLRMRFQRIFEGIPKKGQSNLLIKVYTEVFITEGAGGQLNVEHEVWNVEADYIRTDTQDMPVKCNDIFKLLPGREDSIQCVLTKGIAGIGKTVSVQKFILDWAEGKANEDISLIFPLPFRELNLMKERFSLLGLIQHYHPEMKGCESIDLNNRTVLFIFDGLDECRLPLDFQSNGSCYDVTESTSVDVLLTNLIKGNLLPSALLWITTRPAAANKIPPECVHRMTEVRGFKDQQKEEYFLKRFSDEKLANRIISHVKSSRSLYIMCHIPVFCWISATVLERMLDKPEQKEIPKTLTEMYTHFLLIQTAIKNQKYKGDYNKNPKEIRQQDKEIIVNLGKLAFQQLQKNNLIFYEEDLSEAGIDVSKTSEYSGLCTEIFKEEFGMYEEKMYCFVHLTIQEYLAALSVHLFYTNNQENPLNLDTSDVSLINEDGSIKLSVVHRSAVDQALQSHTGHLDLFLRFLLGISLDSNQALLKGLLTQTGNSSQNIKETVRYIKNKISKSPSPERTINLFHCLNELDDHSLVEDIQSYLESNSLSEQKLTPDQCSALAYVLLMSEEELKVLDLRMYNSTSAGYRRLLPVLKHSRKALLQYCDLTPAICDLVRLVLQSPNSLLRELDLSCNSKLGDKGAKLLCAGLLTPQCRLLNLGLGDCNLTQSCCADLASVLRLPHSELRELDLRGNDLLDSGVRALSAGLEDPRCKLQRLGLSGCQITEEGCDVLASALCSNPLFLRELDLSYNHPGDRGVRALSAVREDPSCKLETLNVEHGGEFRLKPGLHKYGCRPTLDAATANPGVSVSADGGRMYQKVALQRTGDPARFEDAAQVLCAESVTGRCYWEAEWEGGFADVGVAYSGIPRKGIDSGLGLNDQSWNLRSDPQVFVAWHNGKSTSIAVPASRRVGAYLDWPAGTLAFYKITPKGPVHLHTFHTTFTRPLYPAFGVSQDFPLSLWQLR